MSEAKTGLDLLREPFKPHQISKLPKPLKKDAPKGKCSECGGWHGLPAIHLDYVGHAALTDRLLDSDPAWTWEPLAMSPDGLPVIDGYGGMWIRLTVCGVTRLGYGHPDGKEGGNAIKEVIGDALRNAAMRFGAALDLWHKGDLHGDDEEGEKRPAGPTPANDGFNLAVAVAEVKAGLERGDASGAATYVAGLPKASADAICNAVTEAEYNALIAAWPQDQAA